MDTEFLQYYNEARGIAQINTTLRLLCSGFTDGLFADNAFECEVVNLRTGERTTLNNAEDCLDYLYTRDQQAPIELSIHHGSSETIIREPSEMWAFSKPFMQMRMGDNFQESNWHTAHYSMLASLNSETLSIANQLQFKQQVQETSPTQATAWDWLLAKKDAGEDIDALLLRISSFGGNPNHPFSKLRRRISTNHELSQDEVLQYFAEFGNTVRIPLYALNKTCADTRNTLDGESYEQFIQQNYPDQYADWAKQLQQRGLDAAQFVPVPVHPLNEEHLQKTLAEQITRGDVIRTDATIATSATISTRSMKPRTADAPYMKLTMPDIQLTAVARKLSLSAIRVAGPVTDLVKNALKHDPALSKDLRIVGEPCGVYFTPDKHAAYEDFTETMRDQSSSMSALMRENPSKLVKPDEIAIPLAGCFYGMGKDPETGQPSRPFILDIMKKAGVHDADSARSYFREYAQKVIRAELGVFARYGISFEAHQQNSYDIFTRNGHLAARMIQDLADGAQIYRPIYDLSPERRALTDQVTATMSAKNYTFNLTGKVEEPLRQVMHTTFKCHLFPVAAIMGKEFGITKTELMEIMRDEIGATLDDARAQTLPGMDEQQRITYQNFMIQVEDGLLRQPVLAKAFLTTLIAGNLTGYIDKMNQPNPFHSEQSSSMAAA